MSVEIGSSDPLVVTFKERDTAATAGRSIWTSG